MRYLAMLALLAAVALTVTACGEPEDNAVEATEQNAVELGGLRYRVVLFRQLNPRIRPDDALYDGRPPGDGRGIFGAFLQVCNETDEPQTPTGRIQLEDAFGQVFSLIEPEPANDFAYLPRPIEPDRCLPADGDVADRAAPGAVVLFEVPFDALTNRPFVLELRGTGPDGGDEVRRVQLDL